MAPLLHDGDYLVVRKMLTFSKVQTGNIVVVKHPHLGPIVKAVVAVTPKSIKLKGISKLSTCMSVLGDVKKEYIDGIGIAVIPARSGDNAKHDWFRFLKTVDIQTFTACFSP